MSAGTSAVGRRGAEWETAASLSSRSTLGETALWQGVRRLVCRVPTVADVHAHVLESLAVAYWPTAGRFVSPELAAEARSGAHAVLAAPLLLERVRAACDGPLVLLKGPEVTACYPRPAMRSFDDLDLLVPDPRAAYRSLVSAGFVPVGEASRYVGIHHLRPLHLAGFPLTVEIHARPKWIEGVPPPPLEELLAGAVPSEAVSVDGILGLPAAQQTLMLASHSWAHTPFGSLRQLIDTAAVRERASRLELDSLARRWQIERLWHLTDRTLDALLFESRKTWPLHTWARDLPRGRDRTVLEGHLERWLASFAVYPRRRALRSSAAAIRNDLRLGRDDDWHTKLRRTRIAAKNALVRRSEHDAEIERRHAR